VKTVDIKNIYYPPGGILIWIVIFLELITFGMALIAMVWYSKDEPEIFHNSRMLLNTKIGIINTLFLITSGFFMAKSLNYFKEKKIKKSISYLKLTLLGGLLFLLLKSFEYFLKSKEAIHLTTIHFFRFTGC
jgi:nitric oxide reductase NorE protein